MNFTENRYDIGELVYLKTDPYQYKRIVVSWTKLPGNQFLYTLGLGDEQSDHYEFEIAKKPSKKIHND